MQKYRKPLFWGLVLLFVCLVCFCVAAGGYLTWGRPMLQQANNEPGNSNRPDDINLQPTVAALVNEQWKYFNDGDYEKSIAISDRLLSIDPDDPGIYQNRAYILRKAALHKTSLQDYNDMLAEALKTINYAMTLDPNLGALYEQRGHIYAAMGDVQTYRVDREEDYKIAIENFKAVATLRSTWRERPEYWLPFYQFALGECDEGLQNAEYFSPIEDEATNEDLYFRAYACKGDYQAALDHFLTTKKMQNLNPEDADPITYALYLYRLKKPDEALTIMNKSIEKSPHFDGTRYFLRALIEYDQGKFDQALSDAQLAERNNWAFGQYSSYIEGLNAARLGNVDEAIQLLQYAEATLVNGFDFEIERCRNELKHLNSSPLVVTPSAVNIATPMPVYPTLDISTVPTLIPSPVPTAEN